jgi:hypothetical protein
LFQKFKFQVFHTVQVSGFRSQVFEKAAHWVARQRSIATTSTKESSMNGKMTTSVLLVSAAIALGSVASAQVVPPASPIQPSPVQPPTNPNPAVPSMPLQPMAQPANISAGTAAGASSGVAGSVNSPVSRPDVGASTETNASGDIRAGTSVSPKRIDAGSTNQVTIDNRVNGLGAGAVVTGETSASLQADETVRAIQSTRFATRDQVTATVEQRLSATSGLLTELRGRADAAGDASKASFGRAAAEVRQREQNLRNSLKAAGKATSETSWGAAQSQLAQDYSAYARAVAEAEVAARATK